MAIIIKKIKTDDAMSTFEINIRDRESGMHWIAKIKANHVREALEKCKQEVRFGWANLYINSVQEYKTDNSTVGYPHLYGYLDKVILEAKHKAYDSAINVENTEMLRTDNSIEVEDSISDETIRGHFVNAKISEWDPTTLIKRMKETRNGDMHTTLVDKKGNLHTVFLSAWGTTDKAEVWVDVVVETPQGKQDRVFMKKAASWDEALKMMQDYKRKHINDSKIKDDICSSENVKECVQDYRENAFGYDGIADYVQTNYPRHSKDEQDRLIAAMKKAMNDSKPQLLDAAKAQQLVDLVKKAKIVNTMKDDRLSPMSYKKLKELGYDSDDWSDMSQEEANKIIQENKNKSDKKEKKEESKEEKELKTKIEKLRTWLHENSNYYPGSSKHKTHIKRRAELNELEKQLEKLTKSKDSAIKDKSFVEEIIALGREADNARWHFGGDSIDEVKIKKFITAATNSYRYIEQTFMSFMNEVKKNTDESGKWKDPNANIVSIWSNFSNEISSVKEASYRIIDVLDDIVASNHLPDSLKKQADILYRKYKDIYDRIFKSLKK